MFAGATVIAVAVIAVDWFSAGEAAVLIGPLDDQSLLSASMLIASLALVMGLWNISSPNWMLPFKILGILGAVVAVLGAGLCTLVSVEVSRTALLEDGCDTGYVVVERSLFMGSKGTVYQQDGLFIASPMGRTSGNNAHQPFAAGDYTATTKKSALIVEYRVNQGGAATTFSLPAIVDHQPSCGHTNNNPDARPNDTEAAEPAEVLTPASVDEEIRRLLDDSLAATSGTPVGSTGTPVDSSTATLSQVPCVDGTGKQHHIDLEFRTDDNPRSVARILEVWDAAGYERDRAMQEDIRYSETDPVARMTIRDTTSVDGLVRMTITSACMPAE